MSRRHTRTGHGSGAAGGNVEKVEEEKELHFERMNPMQGGLVSLEEGNHEGPSGSRKERRGSVKTFKYPHLGEVLNGNIDYYGVGRVLFEPGESLNGLWSTSKFSLRMTSLV